MAVDTSGFRRFFIQRKDFQPPTVRLAITDDGIGFDPATANLSRFGLRGIRERAGKISADYLLVSKPGQPSSSRINTPSSISDSINLMKPSFF